MSQRPIIFTAAGSGGHVFAAIATLKAFVLLYPTKASNVLFVGSTLSMSGEKHHVSMEERLCQRMNIPFVKIRMGKFQREISVDSVKLLIKVFVGFWDATRLLAKTRPSVIAAFGGYVSLPMVVVGRLFGAKIVIHEQTSNVGLTNRVLQYFAHFIGVTYQTSVPKFRKSVTVVGSPTMKAIYSIDSFDQLTAHIHAENSKLLEEPLYLKQLEVAVQNKKKRPLIFMSGGSQGSHFLNEQVKLVLPELLKKYTVIMQTGENEIYNDFQSLSEYVTGLPADLGHHCIVRKFIYEEYGFLLRQAALFIGRSGANTVYQVGMNQTKALFVPIPWVTRNEQFTNALILRDLGYATILQQADITSEKLLEAIETQIHIAVPVDKENLRPLVFPLDADKRLSQEIDRLAV